MAGPATNVAIGVPNAAVLVAMGPMRVAGMNITNPGSTTAFLQLFDALPANVSVGTTLPLIPIAVPAGQTADLIPGGAWRRFETALTAAATSTPTGSTAATNMIVQVWLD